MISYDKAQSPDHSFLFKIQYIQKIYLWKMTVHDFGCFFFACKLLYPVLEGFPALKSPRGGFQGLLGKLWVEKISCGSFLQVKIQPSMFDQIDYLACDGFLISRSSLIEQL